MGKRMLIVASAVTAIFVCWHGAAAQNKTDSAPYPIERVATAPTSCEFNIAILDAAHSRAGNNSLIIVVARLGQSESSRDLNRRRLHNVKTYLEQFARRKSQTIITAEGSRVTGYGLVELYVNGEHFYTLKLKNNSDLIVGLCSYDVENPCRLERESKLYPCLSPRPPRKKYRGTRAG
ncbi:MAG: hypothetical protein ACK4S4_01535 [Pyrinomonadaceae bacterium]